MRGIPILLTVFAAVLLGGCAVQEPEGSYLSIGKDGTVTQTIVDSFEKEYYSETELSDSIRRDIADYPARGSIELTEVTAPEEEKIRVVMKYSDYRDYSGMNESVLFVGTVLEADMAGYSMNVRLYDKAGKNTVYLLDGLYDDYKVCIAQKGYTMVLPTDVMYLSAGAVLQNKKTVDVSGVTDELVYILIK